MSKSIVVVLSDVRSAHNVGSITRSADAFGCKTIIACGITPHPKLPDDKRLPHVVERAGKQIAKTALGAEKEVEFEHIQDISKAIAKLRREGYIILALEQSQSSIPISEYEFGAKVAIIAGAEVDGLSEETIESCDTSIEIPMHGRKESLNVAVAVAIALFVASN